MANGKPRGRGEGVTTRPTVPCTSTRQSSGSCPNATGWAVNPETLDHPRWVMEMSLVKTLAGKLRISVPQVFRRYKATIPTERDLLRFPDLVYSR